MVLWRSTRPSRTNTQNGYPFHYRGLDCGNLTQMTIVSSTVCKNPLCLHPQGCLRRGVRASGPSQVRTGESGAFGLWPHPRGSSDLVKNWLTGKDPDAGKDWRQEEKGTTEDEMVKWHHQLDGHEFEQTPGVGDGQGSLACCSPWGCKRLDMTEQLNWLKNPLFSPSMVFEAVLPLWPLCV